jgi:hypothetical protein
MSAHTRTPPSLQILSGGSERAEVLRLEPTARLQAFLQAAASHGLGTHDAVRLGLERALCLRDASGVAIDVETARRILGEAARGARPSRGLAEGQAAYLRALGAGRPAPRRDVVAGIGIEVPERVLSRVEGSIGQGVLHEGVVEEMLSWEIAAVLDARTMNEWALLQLLGRRGARP